MMIRLRPYAFLVAVQMAAGLLVACDRDVRLAGHNLRNVHVRTVVHYGMTLDPSATPKQVAFVLLRAIREDALADNKAAREAALDIQFDVCAAGQILARYDVGLSPPEAIYNVVYRWTPAVAHYANDFEVDWEQAQNRLVELGQRPAAEGASAERQVALEVADPHGDPNASAILIVGLIQDNGYWRVLGLTYSPQRRTIAKGRSGTKEPATPATTQGDP